MNQDECLKRAKQAAMVKKDNEFASLLGLSPQDFSNRKKREKLLPLILEWAAREGVDASWLLTGNDPVEKTVTAPYKEDEKDTTSSLASDGKCNWKTQPTTRPPPYLSEDDRIRIERRLINAFWNADESTRSHAMILLEDSAKPEGNAKNGMGGQLSSNA